MDVVIIKPEAGNQKEIGRRLLELADSPYDVQWVTWPTPGGFQVPLELFNKFDTDSEDGAESEAPKRRRGRPRKETSTDNNTSEEE